MPFYLFNLLAVDMLMVAVCDTLHSDTLWHDRSHSV